MLTLTETNTHQRTGNRCNHTTGSNKTFW